MRGSTGLAIVGTILVLASPAAARDRPGEGGEAKSFLTAPATSRLLANSRQSVTLDARGLIHVPEPNAPRLFGSLPVADNVDLGVGLFSVVGTTEKEQVRRRMDPARDFVRSGTRVAAVGMSLRF